MDGKKVYQISINGIEYSIKQVDALSDSLQFLDKKIKELESRSVNVSSTTSKGGGSNERALQSEDQLLKQIQKTQQQIADARREDYNSLLAQKDLLHDIVDEAKARAASERLTSGNYGNTMKGMKQELADIKSVMQTTDLGSDQFQELTTRANELTQNLKNIEESYGQYGRNVGNYANSIAEGMNKVKIQVGGVDRTFSSAKEASRELSNELKTMAVNGEQNTEKFDELRKVIAQLNSDIKDATVSSQGMDNMLDTMQSFTSLAQVGQGVSSLFGFDQTEMTRSIEKLVSLQNILQGIEKIKQQMMTEEGLGGLFKNASASIDNFVAKLTGAKVTMDGLTMSTKVATYAVKGLSMAFKGIAAFVAMEVVMKLVNSFTNLIKSLDTTQNKIARIERQMKSLDSTYKNRMNELSSAYMRGTISNEEFVTRQYKLQSEYLSEQIELLQKKARLESNRSSDVTTTYEGGRMTSPQTYKIYNDMFDNGPIENLIGLIPINKTIKDIKELEEEFEKARKAVEAGVDYYDMWGKGVSGTVKSIMTTVEDTEDYMYAVGRTRLEHFIGDFRELEKQAKNATISPEEYAEGLKKLNEELTTNKVLTYVVSNMSDFYSSDNIVTQIKKIIDELKKLDDAYNSTSLETQRFWKQVEWDGMKDDWKKIEAQLKYERKTELEQYGKTKKQRNALNKKWDKKEKDARKKYFEQQSKEYESAYKDLNALIIENMDEGLRKEKAKLNEEKRQRLKAAVESGILVGERRKEIEELYAKKIEEVIFKTKQSYIDLWEKIFDLSNNNIQLKLDINIKDIEEEYKKFQEKAKAMLDITTATYSNRGINVTKKTRKPSNDDLYFNTNKGGKEKDSYDIEVERADKYTKRLREEYEKRIANRTEYFNEVEKLSIDRVNKLYDIENEKAAAAQSHELASLQNAKEARLHEIKEYLLTAEERNEAEKRLTKELEEQEILITEKYQAEAIERERKREEEIKTIRSDSYQSNIEEYRKYLEELSNVDTSEIMNGLGFINLSATRKRNKELLDSLEKLKNDIIAKKEELQQSLDNKEITFDDFEQAKSELEDFEEQIGNFEVEIDKNGKEAAKSLFDTISQYASQLGSSLNSLVSAIGDYTDQQFENEINKLEKFINEYEEKLNEQQKITQEHASNLQSIEQELADSRGARRQALIDKLNAEMAAQRASLAEEKHIEKEKKKLEDKKEKEEKERLKAQKKVKTTQAIINGAVAFMNALATEPIWLGIAMASMTAAMTAIQLATINSAKYADGGVIQGRSHAQGGVKVLGGNAEVEGGEYITNKATTSKNVELLDYINARKKKLDLDDMIEFYSSGKGVKKTISTTRTKFADGGVIPTLRSDISVNDRLIQSFEDYSNRPVQVAVVDIMDKTQQVNNVRVMAGLSD